MRRGPREPLRAQCAANGCDGPHTMRHREESGLCSGHKFGTPNSVEHTGVFTQTLSVWLVGRRKDLPHLLFVLFFLLSVVSH